MKYTKLGKSDLSVQFLFVYFYTKAHSRDASLCEADASQLRAMLKYATMIPLFNGRANARKLLPLEYKSGR